MSALPIKLSDDWLDYSAEGILHEPVIQTDGIVSNSKNKFNQIMNKPSMNQLLEVWKKIGDFFNRAKRMAYLPKTAVSVAALSAALAANPTVWNAQCCGIDYNMLGIYWSAHTEHNDAYANRVNGHTYDWRNAWLYSAWIWWDGLMRWRYSVSAWGWYTEKYQDSKNNYRKYNFEAKWNIWLWFFTDRNNSESLYWIFVTWWWWVEKDFWTALIRWHTVYLTKWKPFLEAQLWLTWIFNQYAWTDIIGFIRRYPNKDETGLWNDYKLWLTVNLWKLRL